MLKRKIIFKGLPKYELHADDMISISDVYVLLGVNKELPPDRFGKYAHDRNINSIQFAYVFPAEIIRKIKVKG